MKPSAVPRHEELHTASLADVRRVLEREPSLARKFQPMLDAACARRADVLKLLLERGGDPNAICRGYRPLHSLAQREPHADPEELSQASSAAAPRSGARPARSIQPALRLLARGANPGAADARGRTALHRAATSGWCARSSPPAPTAARATPTERRRSRWRARAKIIALLQG